jgi:hypothetical protein
MQRKDPTPATLAAHRALACAGLAQLLALLDRSDFRFNIVTP